MEFNIFLIITLLTSLQLLLLDISDIFMVFILPVKVSFLICPLCSLYHGECSAVGPGALKPSVGDGIESRRLWFCSPVSLYSFLCCLSILHHYIERQSKQVNYTQDSSLFQGEKEELPSVGFKPTTLDDHCTS